MKTKKNPILFLPVPNSLNDEIRRFTGRHSEEAIFKIDPSILLPVELAPGEKTFDPEKLSWEMIISGMLRIISAVGGNSQGMALIKAGDIVDENEIANVPVEWIDYYRGFIFTVKPEIFHEFTGAAVVKAKNGDFDMALEINAVLEGLFPLSPGVLLNKALILEDKAAALEKNGHGAEKENAETLAAYETALSLKPVFPDTLFNAGFFFMRRRDFARAKECFFAYISTGNDISCGNASEIDAKKKKQAEKIIREIDSQGLDDPGIKEAHDCISRGNDEEGLLIIREFIERHPRVWNGWFILGWALRKLGRYAGGLEAFKKALELGGHSSDIRNETAICLMELGDLKGARKELETALREDTENIKIISNMGVLAQKAGKKEEAAAFFRTVLELDPNDPLARHFLEN